MAALAHALATRVSACKLNSYCLACASDDAGGSGSGGSGDGGVRDGGGGDAGAGSDASTAGCDPSALGKPCPKQIGECSGALTACAAGAVVCVANGVQVPRAELCDGLDNDCNGETDEGDPGGGGRCDNGTGTCLQGVDHCVAGALACQGAVGPSGEICDGLDNDCDGVIDNGLSNLGACGTSSVGACKLGLLACTGGTTVCTGAVAPTFELCNQVDDDCDGKVDEDYNTQTDPQNCGACGNVCGSNLAAGGNAVWACSTGQCVIASCKAGFHDDNNSAADGCEFGQCFVTGQEVCDGLDNDCDGVIDEQPAIGAPPAICATRGECAGTVATCPCANTPTATGCPVPGGWTCHYPTTVQTDASGNIVAETICDGKDNDCNGTIDDHQPQVSHQDGTVASPQSCNDGKIGTCEGVGQFQCDDGSFAGSTPGGNLPGPAVCDITSPGAAPGAETCNGRDDDCDGFVDEGAPDAMVSVKDGSGTVLFQIYAFEASHPDATAGSGGLLGNRSCSRSNVLPWTAVTEDQAAAACAAAGKRLCTSAEWQLACAGTAGLSYPYGNTYSATACNGKDYDPNCSAPDDDTVLPTGTSYGCPAPAASVCVSPTGAFDMSGNVQEWTSTPKSAGVFSVRGGAFDTPAGGLTCQFDFVSFTHDFEFNNLGFRCCQGP